MTPTIIIAEAGVNHNGDIDLAKKMVEVAAKAGADYVKFQTFTAGQIASPAAPKAGYQKIQTGSSGGQLEMFKGLELGREQHYMLKEYCEEKKIKFLSSAFDMESLRFLIKLGIDFIKIPSGEITNAPMLEATAESGLPVVISTGMCTMDEVEDSIAVLEMNGMKKEKITILHCNTEYPSPYEDVNLRAMLTLRGFFGTKTGYSDHTPGIEVALAAVALGASVIEKHFTLDRDLPGPDHKASLLPEEIYALVKGIRNIEKALGSEEKFPTPSESKNIHIARKSIHLKHDLARGKTLTPDDLLMLRPGDGISPMEYKKVAGRKLKSAGKKFHKLTWEDLD